MTEKWNELSPGKRNALVAVEVMGWEENIDSDKLPNYSTNIADAWKVFQKFQKQNWVVRIESYRDEWEAQFGRYKSFGRSAPEAICLAALKAAANMKKNAPDDHTVGLYTPEDTSQSRYQSGAD